MIRKNLKRSNKNFFVRYTLIAGAFLCLFAVLLSAGLAEQESPFTEVVSSLRNPFMKWQPKPAFVKKVEKPVVVEIKPVEPAPPPVKKIAKPVKLPRLVLPKMSVTGLIFKTKQPQAIINGQVVGVGDIVARAKVLKIKEGGIIFKYADEIYFVKYFNK